MFIFDVEKIHNAAAIQDIHGYSSVESRAKF